MKKLIILTAFLTSCAPVKRPVVQDSTLVPYAAQFQALTGYGYADVSLQFGDLPAPKLGTCTKDNLGKTITIDRTYWASAPEQGKLYTVMHELGHCSMNLAHNDAMGNLGPYKNIPLSIMNEYNFGNQQFFSVEFDYYVRELINEAKENL